MSKYISIGAIAVGLAELNALSGDDKKKVIDAMFGDALGDKLDVALMVLECDVQTDNKGQIVLYTDMMYSNKEGDVVPFTLEPSDDDDEADPYEEEEQPITLGYGIKAGAEEALPPTLRPEDIQESIRVAS